MATRRRAAASRGRAVATAAWAVLLRLGATAVASAAPAPSPAPTGPAVAIHTPAPVAVSASLAPMGAPSVPSSPTGSPSPAAPPAPAPVAPAPSPAPVPPPGPVISAPLSGPTSPPSLTPTDAPTGAPTVAPGGQTGAPITPSPPATPTVGPPQPTQPLAPSAAQAAALVPLHGAGTTNPQFVMWSAICTLSAAARRAVRPTYRSVGSGTGQEEFAAELNHYGMGDVPMPKDMYESEIALSGGMLHVPFLVGAIGFYHSLPADAFLAQHQAALPALNLTGCLAAAIFQRNVTSWGDSSVLELNPALNASALASQAAEISVVHRELGSSSTAGATEYMQRACPSGWELGAGEVIDWPKGTTGAQGSSGIAAFLEETPYGIGYLSAGDGARFELPEAAVANADGAFVLSGINTAGCAEAASAAVSGGLLPADPSADWSSVNLYNLPGSATYPICQFTYFYLRPDISSYGASGTLLKAFVQYLLSDRGQALVQDNAFAALPDAVLEYNAATLESLVVADAPTWSFEDETEPLVGAGEYVLSFRRVPPGACANY